MNINHNKTQHAVWVCLFIQAVAVIFLFVGALWLPDFAPIAMGIVFGMALAIIVILLFSLYDKN